MRLLELNYGLTQNLTEQPFIEEGKAILLERIKQEICTPGEPSIADAVAASPRKMAQIQCIQSVENFLELQIGWQQLEEESAFMEILKGHGIYPRIFYDSITALTSGLPVDDFIIHQTLVKNTAELYTKFYKLLSSHIEKPTRLL